MNISDYPNSSSNLLLYYCALKEIDITTDLKKESKEEEEAVQPEAHPNLESNHQDRMQELNQQTDLRRREVEAAALLLHYPKDGAEQHKAFLLQILTGIVSEDFVKSFQEIYLKDDEKISDKNLAHLLLNFYTVMVLATEKQKIKLFSEFVEAIEGKNRLKALQNCLHLDYTAEEFDQVLRSQRFFILPPNIKLKISHIETSEWNVFAPKAEKGLSWEDIKLLLNNRIKENNESRLRTVLEEGLLEVNYCLEPETRAFSIQLSLPLQFQRIALKTYVLKDLMTQVMGQQDKIFNFGLNSEITFTGLSKKQLRRINAAASKIHVFHEIITAIVNQNSKQINHVWLLINGPFKLSLDKNLLVFAVSKGGILEFNHPAIYNDRQAFASGVLMVDAPINFNLGKIIANIK